MSNGIIETASGDLLRYGNCDFSSDGSFNPEIETLAFDVPDGAICRKIYGGDYTSFNGVIWQTVIRVPFKPKSKETIFFEVLSGATSELQDDRLVTALDLWCTVGFALDSHNYTLANDRMEGALTAGNILAEDVTLILSKFPTGWDS